MDTANRKTKRHMTNPRKKVPATNPFCGIIGSARKQQPAWLITTPDEP